MGRIDSMKTVSVMNLISYEELAAYGNWMRKSHKVLEETAPKCGKRVLGRQDFCWYGSYYRNWIWERPFEVDLAVLEGNLETWNWRLFASARGFSLEVEDKYNRPDGARIKVACSAALDNFLKTWNNC